MASDNISKGARIWLWFVLVVNCLSAIGLLRGFAISPLITILTLVLEAILIFGVVLMLFKQKKLGFYLVCGMAAFTLVLNIIGGSNLILSIVSAVVMPGITFLFIRNDFSEWD